MYLDKDLSHACCCFSRVLANSQDSSQALTGVEISMRKFLVTVRTGRSKPIQCRSTTGRRYQHADPHSVDTCKTVPEATKRPFTPPQMPVHAADCCIGDRTSRRVASLRSSCLRRRRGRHLCSSPPGVKESTRLQKKKKKRTASSQRRLFKTQNKHFTTFLQPKHHPQRTLA